MTTTSRELHRTRRQVASLRRLLTEHEQRMDRDRTYIDYLEAALRAGRPVWLPEPREGE
ncbi:MAG TPA: hypothetical protein VFJ19_09440 [Nocardioidaceae bacterium]|nr:hypothetical protein [Nocardioidaceae bacterium]